MKIAYDNLLKNAQYTVSSEFTNYKLGDCLSDTRLVRKYRTSSKVNQYISFSFAEAKAPSHFGIIAHNLTKTAVIRIQASSSDTFSTLAVNELVDNSLMSGKDNRLLYRLTNTSAYKYWRIYIDDSANSSAYLLIGKLYLGSCLMMPAFSPEVVVGYGNNSVVQKSDSRQLYGKKKKIYKVVQAKFNSISLAERELIEAMYNEVGSTTPVWLLLYDNDPTDEPLIYVNITKEPSFKKLSMDGNYYSLELEFEECF